MVTNPLILTALKQYAHDIKAPKDMEKLMDTLLDIEGTVKYISGNSKGMDKLYDHALKQYVDNAEMIKWSENYARW